MYVLDNVVNLSIIVFLNYLFKVSYKLILMKQIYFFFFFLLMVLIGFTQELIPKQHKSKWGFVNAKEEWIVKAKFSEVKNYSEGLACVRIKKKWGFINKEGKKVIKFQYSNANSFQNGHASVRSYKVLPGNTRENNNQFKWGFINQSGTLTIPYKFKEVQDFDVEERVLVQLFNMKKNEFFWMNTEGVAISPPFTKKEKIGTIYKVQNNRNDGLKVFRYLQNSGTPITEWYLNDFDLSDSLIKVWLPSSNENDTIEVPAYKGNSKKKLCAFINKNGDVLSDWYSEIQPFVNGYAPIRHHHLFGFIDQDYKLVGSPTYRELSLLRDNIYKGQVEYGKTVLLNYKGDRLSLYAFDFEEYSTDMFIGQHQLKSSYKSEDKYAVYDKEGNQKTGWFNKVHEIHNDIVRVEDERLDYTTLEKREYVTMYNYVSLESGELLSKWRKSAQLTWQKDQTKHDSILTFLYLSNAVINIDKEFFSTIFIKEFDFLENKRSVTFSGGDFHNGYALVAKKGTKIQETRNGLQITKDVVLYGYIDWYGDLVIPYRYKEAAAFRDEYAIVGNGDTYGVINSRGRKVLAQQHLMLGAYGSGLFPVLSKKGLWGYVNRENRIQIEYQYDRVMPFSYGYASVKKGRNWGLIDVMGNEVMQLDYKKPIEVISPLKVRYLKNGVGYREKRIDEL